MTFIDVDKVSKRFGGLMAISEVSFGVEIGQIVGIIGPNGAGKTTLFNVISGYYAPDGGEVLLDGQKIAGLSPHQVCWKGIARTFQITRPFPRLSVLDNALIGACHCCKNIKLARDVAEQIVETVGLGAKKNLLAVNLSTADRKKLELARALASNPRVLLLDEPAAGLNPTEVNAFLSIVKTVAEEKNLTILIVEHILQVIMNLCSKIIVLDEGKKLGEGSPQEVARDPKVIAAYLGDEYAPSQGG